ncbi:MAG: glutamate mutase L [Anaerolineae bacterium]
MATEQQIGSILLADCGTAMTKVVLLDRVGEQYRFIARGEAPTTAEYPWFDVAAGIHHAAEEITAVTGQDFFDGSGELTIPELSGRQGVDALAATVSASQPLQVVVGGLVRDMSAASAERAAAGTYSLVKAILTGESRGILKDEDIVHAVHDAAPDVICIAGGTEGGAETPVLELVRTAALACSLLDPERRPCLLYAGNSRLRQRVVKTVEGRAELRVADNVRPILTEENLLSAQTELETLYLNKMGLLPGIETVSEWSSAPLTPTARAFGRLVEYLWHLGDPSKGVLGIDVGAANTTVAAVFDERLFLTVRSGLGVAFGGEKLLQKQGAETITRWLPEPMSGDEVRGLLINKEMRPTSIPQVERELWLEQALAREAIRTTLKVAHPGWKPGVAQPYPHLLPLCDTIVVSGGVLTHAPRPSQAALIVLDALQPIGVTTLVLDRYGLAPLLGSAAAVKPLAAVEALDGGSLVNLATVVTPVAGRARRGDIILKVQATYDDNSALSVEVRYGDMEVLPLLPGQQAVLELQPLRYFDVGLGGPGKGGKRRVSGGLAGLIIDARGRPLCLPSDPERRQAQVQRWRWDVGG